MILALTCALCAAAAVHPPAPHQGDTALRLTLDVAPPAAPGALEATGPLRALATLPGADLPVGIPGSGDGDHSDHMSTMWIVMGGMMAIVMVGMGAYLMRHGSPATPPRLGAAPAPAAAYALPVASPGAG
jgi:hypothetical protein